MLNIQNVIRVWPQKLYMFYFESIYFTILFEDKLVGLLNVRHYNMLK